MEALLRVRHRHLLGRLVKQAVDIGSQRVEGALAAVHLERPIESSSRLHRHISIAEEDVVAHQTPDSELGESRLPGDQLRPEGLTIMLQVSWMEVVPLQT